VLRFNPNTLAFVDVYIDDQNPSFQPNHLNRPEGLAFGPDGRLYVTSFQASSSDIDSIRIYDVTGSTGVLVDVINLEIAPINTPPIAGLRTAAQALLFGPDGKLFVPIEFVPASSSLGLAVGDPAHVGEVRLYDVASHNSTDVVPPFSKGGPLKSPSYLTFGRTNSATLAYGD
jgi:hypothetical protein